MKKTFLIFVSAVLVAVFFVTSISAANFDPIYSSGPELYTGYWSMVTGHIQGTFQLHYSLSDLVNKSFALVSPCRILYDERDEDGNGLCYWVLNVSFSEGFAVDSRYIEYSTLKLVFREYNSEGVGYLNDAVVIADSWEAALFRYFPEGQSTYLSDSFLYFGTTYSNLPSLGDNTLRWMMSLFSGPVVDGKIQNFIGLFKPVVYSSTGAGPGGGSDGGGSEGAPEDPPEDLPDDPAIGFSRFAFLIFDLFRQLLSISFFGGFFTIGDLVGVVFSLGLLTLFLKWYAGG